MNGLPVFETIKKRMSCRSYTGAALSGDDRAALERELGGCLSNPFGAAVRLPLLDNDRLAGRKLGTYGVIRGARQFIAGIAKAGPLDAEGLGYSMERAVLLATANGLGTCWLAGTFRREDFRDAAGLGDGERIVCVSPVGEPADRRTALDALMRGAAGSAKRKPWEKLFFDGAWGTALREEAAGAYRDALEAVRLAPSASNGQPWRVLRQGRCFHFYRAGGEHGRVDMGIAACHFELVARERGLDGAWERVGQAPAGEGKLQYFVSWVRG